MNDLIESTHTTDLDHEKVTNQLTFVGVAGNVALSALKIIAGIFGNSAAMISDAVHSLSDVAATAIAYVGVRYARKNDDDDHQYGHERFECLASLILGVILAAAGIGIGYAGIMQIAGAIQGTGIETEPPTVLAAAAAILSIAAKEAMYRYTHHFAKLINSPAFLADAKHHRSDALSSIGALVGIAATMAGFEMGDALASIVICGFILKMAAEVLTDAISNMMDSPVSTDEAKEIRDCLSAVQGIQRVDLLKTRVFGSKVYVDAEIAIDGLLSLYEAHEIAEAAHDHIEAEFPNVKHIMIHVNPA